MKVTSTLIVSRTFVPEEDTMDDESWEVAPLTYDLETGVGEREGESVTGLLGREGEEEGGPLTPPLARGDRRGAAGGGAGGDFTTPASPVPMHICLSLPCMLRPEYLPLMLLVTHKWLALRLLV